MPKASEVFVLWDSVFRAELDPAGVGFGWNVDPPMVPPTIERAAGLCNDWKLSTSTAATPNPADTVVHLVVQPLSGSLRVNSYVVARHNLFAAGITQVEVQARANPGTWFSVAGSQHAITDDEDIVQTFTDVGAWDLWALAFSGPTPPLGQIQLGIATLGYRLENSNIGIRPQLDPFGFRIQLDDGALEFGSPSARRTAGIRRRFNFDYPSPGLPAAFFDRVAFPTYAQRFGDLEEHIAQALPFWLAWDLANYPRDVSLVRTNAFGQPVLGSSARRGLTMALEGFKERP